MPEPQEKALTILEATPVRGLNRQVFPRSADFTNSISSFNVRANMFDRRLDEYLDTKGLVRIHLPGDGSCLFRAVAQELYKSQEFHKKVRVLCVAYMRQNRPLFEKYVDDDYNAYLDRMLCSTEWAGHAEMYALSKLYNVEFFIYDEPDCEPKRLTEDECCKRILLCFSHGNHFDLVRSHKEMETLALAQSRELIERPSYIRLLRLCIGTVYECLYSQVLGVDQDTIEVSVRCMLHEKPNKASKSPSPTSSSSDVLCAEKNGVVGDCSELSEEKSPETSDEFDLGSISKDSKYLNITDELAESIRQNPPFPFKVAKCLSRHVFRNVDLVMWIERQRQWERDRMIVPVLDVGVKCHVRLDPATLEKNAHVAQVLQKKVDSRTAKNAASAPKRDPSDVHQFTGYVQSLNDDTVKVYVQDLCVALEVNRNDVTTTPVPLPRFASGMGGAVGGTFGGGATKVWDRVRRQFVDSRIGPTPLLPLPMAQRNRHNSATVLSTPTSSGAGHRLNGSRWHGQRTRTYSAHYYRDSRPSPSCAKVRCTPERSTSFQSSLANSQSFATRRGRDVPPLEVVAHDSAIVTASLYCYKGEYIAGGAPRASTSFNAPPGQSVCINEYSAQITSTTSQQQQQACYAPMVSPPALPNGTICFPPTTAPVVPMGEEFAGPFASSPVHPLHNTAPLLPRSLSCGELLESQHVMNAYCSMTDTIPEVNYAQNGGGVIAAYTVNGDAGNSSIGSSMLDTSGVSTSGYESNQHQSFPDSYSYDPQLFAQSIQLPLSQIPINIGVHQQQHQLPVVAQPLQMSYNHGQHQQAMMAAAMLDDSGVGMLQDSTVSSTSASGAMPSTAYVGSGDGGDAGITVTLPVSPAPEDVNVDRAISTAHQDNLPFDDIPTLRYFYNLGVDYYRGIQMLHQKYAEHCAADSSATYIHCTGADPTMLRPSLLMQMPPVAVPFTESG